MRLPLNIKPVNGTPFLQVTEREAGDTGERELPQLLPYTLLDSLVSTHTSKPIIQYIGVCQVQDLAPTTQQPKEGNRWKLRAHFAC